MFKDVEPTIGVSAVADRALDGWRLFQDHKIAKSDGINLRAGTPALFAKFLDPSEWVDKLALGKVTVPFAYRCTFRFDKTSSAAIARHKNDGWDRWRLTGELVASTDDTHFRLLAFSGSNGDRDVYNRPRGRFLFGGVMLTRIADS